MESINITPEVIKLMEQFSKKGIKESTLALEVLRDNKLLVFQKPQTSIFWIEGDKPKWAVKHIITRLTRENKMSYQANQEVSPVKKVINKILKKEDEEELHNASAIDLRQFVKKYMKGYKMTPQFRKVDLTPEEMGTLVKEVDRAYTEGIENVIKQIYGGEKENYRTKNKMNDDDRQAYSEQNKEEREWFFDNLVWLCKPSKDFVKKFRNDYGKLTNELRTHVVNGIVMHRATKLF